MHDSGGSKTARLNEKVWMTLRELVAIEPLFLSMLISGFLETAEKRLEQLATGDGDVKQIAHAFRGAALQVGADALASACGRLESEPTRTEALLPPIREQLEYARTALLERVSS